MSARTDPQTLGINTIVNHGPGNTLGYARDSASEQNPESQNALLIQAGASRVRVYRVYRPKTSCGRAI